jgi:hypothetical protein
LRPEPNVHPSWRSAKFAAISQKTKITTPPSLPSARTGKHISLPRLVSTRLQRSYYHPVCKLKRTQGCSDIGASELRKGITRNGCVPSRKQWKPHLQLCRNSDPSGPNQGDAQGTRRNRRLKLKETEAKTNGEPGGTRTRDPLLKRQMLCQLSYRPHNAS